MQVVLLVGGMGTRLRPLTYDTPKPLLPVLNRPLVAHILERLPKRVDEVLLTVSYRSDDLREWIRASDDPSLDGRTVRVIDEPEPLGTAGAVKNCSDRLDDTFLVLNGDLVSDLDIGAHIETHERRGASGSLALHAVEEVSRFGVVDWTPATGRIHAFVEKPAPGTEPSRYVNAGAYVLEPEVLDLIPSGRAVSLEHEVFPRLVEDVHGLYGLPFKGLWIDCGTPRSYLDIHEALLQRADLHNLIGPGTGYDAERMEVEASVLGSGVRLGDGVRVERSVVHDGAELGAGVRLVRSVVGRDAKVAPRCVLTDVVVGPGSVVQAPEPLEGVRVGMRDPST